MSAPPVLEGRPYHEFAIEAIEDLLAATGLDLIDIVGNSMGARVAAEFSLAHPERVRRLVLMGAGGVGTNILAPSPSEGIRRLVDFNEVPTRERMVAWLESMVAERSILTDELVDERFRNATHPDALEWSRVFRDHRLSGRSDTEVPLWVRAARIRQPTLLTWGRDDRVVPLENALLPMRTIPNAELHVFSRCGHWAMIERKSDFERVVLEFLTRPDVSTTDD